MEQYTQKEIDNFFTSLALPNFSSGLPIYEGSGSESDLEVYRTSWKVVTNEVPFLNLMASALGP